ncbi:MAG: YcjX family protein [Halocynthiibacter sp.]
MVLSQLTQNIEDLIEDAKGSFSDRVIRVGVTGLSRAGKTVFITSLISNLLDRGRMSQLEAVQSGRLSGAYLQPQPDDTIPRFDYERHFADMAGGAPVWPQGTDGISQLRLSMTVQPSGLLASVSGPRKIHLDIVDYPGEWLLDLGLLEMNYDTWSKMAIAALTPRDQGAKYRALTADIDGADPFINETAKMLSACFTTYLMEAKSAGFSNLTPGRFMMPGALAGSPALTFAPLPDGPAPRGSLKREMQRRFEAYKSQVVKPFFRDHFTKLDRQIVLVDVLDALEKGPAALFDLGQAMNGLLEVFRPGQNTILRRLFGSKRIEKVLFAATKADHVHHTQHAALAGVLTALLRDARDRADYMGAQTETMSIAALRATTEETRTIEGARVDLVRGRLDTGKTAALYVGELPQNPSKLIAAANAGADEWPDGAYTVPDFAPTPLTLASGQGLPHIRMDRALDFLIGETLR